MPNSAVRHDPDKIDKFRVRAGLSQTQLAEAAGISKNHLSQVLNGKSGIAADKIAALARVLERDVGDLLADDPPAGDE